MKCEHQYMIFYYWHNIWRVNTSILFSNTGTTTYEVWTPVYYLLILAQQQLVRDSSAVRRLFLTCCSRGTSESSTYGKQRICLSNSWSAHFHVSRLSDFIFYQKPLYKSLHQSFFYSLITILPSESGVYTPLQHDFALDPMIPPFVFQFSNICHVTTRKPRLPQRIMGDDLHINKQTNIFIANRTRLLRQNN